MGMGGRAGGIWGGPGEEGIINWSLRLQPARLGAKYIVAFLLDSLKQKRECVHARLFAIDSQFSIKGIAFVHILYMLRG
jgi:hypothetical protein